VTIFLIAKLTFSERVHGAAFSKFMDPTVFHPDKAIIRLYFGPTLFANFDTKYGAHWGNGASYHDRSGK